NRKMPVARIVPLIEKANGVGSMAPHGKSLKVCSQLTSHGAEITASTYPGRFFLHPGAEGRLRQDDKRSRQHAVVIHRGSVEGRSATVLEHMENAHLLHMLARPHHSVPVEYRNDSDSQGKRAESGDSFPSQPVAASRVIQTEEQERRGAIRSGSKRPLESPCA